MTTERVAVVGAGPAGSVTAFRLAEAGVSVDLIDAAAFPREKACGDLIGTRTVEALVDLGLGRTLDGGHRIEGERFFDDADWCVRETRLDAATSTFPVALPRFDFDAALREAAGRAGAELIRAKCTGIGATGRRGRSLVLVDTAGRKTERTYRFVIGADGARSAVARRVGLHPGLAANHAVTIRRYVSTDHDLARHLWFFVPDDEAAPSTGPAYCWAFPVAERRLNIGIYVCAPAAGRNLTSRLEAFTRRLERHFGTEGILSAPTPVRGGIVRYDFDPARVASDGIALVGDAAGLGHALVGEGILYAVRSGSLVADAIVAASPGDTTEAVIADALDAAFTADIDAARTAAHEGRSVIGGPGATFGPRRGSADPHSGDERTRLLRRVVDQATASEPVVEGRPAPRRETAGERRWTQPGDEVVRIPAHRTVRFELVGGGGAGGHWQGGGGGTAPRITGTIPGRDAAWELHVWCGEGGRVDPAAADGVPSLGGPAGRGFGAGGDGGWGSGNGAGGAGGGGGASALTAGDTVMIVAPGGGGGGGGGGPLGHSGGDGEPRHESSTAPPATDEPGGAGGYGVTRAGLRGGGGGGGGGGRPGGDGGQGGIGGDGGAGGTAGTAATTGADPESVLIEAVRPTVAEDDPGMGGRGGVRVGETEIGTLGEDGSDGLVALWW